ncbi:hypothetical protein E4T56_gene20174 [Termitomyces sp. T112]|nr:hypothetical protein E4T56_gene20174 [Termitomyces sp. T112]
MHIDQPTFLLPTFLYPRKTQFLINLIPNPPSAFAPPRPLPRPPRQEAALPLYEPRPLSKPRADERPNVPRPLAIVGRVNLVPERRGKSQQYRDDALRVAFGSSPVRKSRFSGNSWICN